MTMRTYGKAPQATLTEGTDEESKTREQLECEHFRNVFGPLGNRSESQIYVMRWLRQSLAIDSPILMRTGNEHDIIGRAYLHDVGIEIVRRADSEFEPKKRKPVEVDRSRGNPNQK